MMKTKYRVTNHEWQVEIEVKPWFWPFWLPYSEYWCFYKLRLTPGDEVKEFDSLAQAEKWADDLKRNYYPEINMRSI